MHGMVCSQQAAKPGIGKLRLEIRLMPPAKAKPLVKRRNNGTASAEGGLRGRHPPDHVHLPVNCETMQRPGFCGVVLEARFRRDIRVPTTTAFLRGQAAFRGHGDPLVVSRRAEKYAGPDLKPALVMSLTDRGASHARP